MVAHQSGEAIFNLAASFCRPEEGISHQDDMPEAPPPEECEDWEQARAKALGMASRWHAQAVELRMA